MTNVIKLNGSRTVEELLSTLDEKDADVCIVIFAKRERHGFSGLRIEVGGTEDTTESYLLTDLAHSIIEREII